MSITIECDNENCEATTPLATFGDVDNTLFQVGWQIDCDGGSDDYSHYCPKHKNEGKES